MSSRSFNFIKGVYQGIRDRLLFSILSIRPIQKNKIVVLSFHGRGYGDNPKAIINQLLSIGRTDLDIKWLVNDMDEIMPGEIGKIKNTVWNRAFHLSTARVWIDNNHKPFGTHKRKKQLYIQTWHGPIGFKPVGKLMKGMEFIPYLAWLNDAKMADYFISNSKWCTEMYRKEFWYTGKVMKVGSPRCDILFQKDKLSKKVFEKLDIKENSHILIYTPTFRGQLSDVTCSTVKGDLCLNYKLLKWTLEQKFGGEWYILLRLHPMIVDKSIVVIEGCNFVIDISNENDLYEYLSVADAFLTDYSSAGFDAAYGGIPVFLYVNDKEEYEHSRGDLLWDLEELPFPFAKTEEELLNNILQFDNINYLAGLKELFQKVELKEDGMASKRVSDVICQFLNSCK